MQLVDIPNAGEGASAIWERLLLIPLPVIIFWIIWVIYKSIKNEQEKEQYKEVTTKSCPDCLASIPKLAKKCMHCGTIQPDLQVEKQKAITQPADNGTFADGAKLALLFGIPVLILVYLWLRFQG
jgi:hypothetical protein